ncbi:Transient receptor potential cation channel subfamily M member 6 [Paramuricea clavata]|uniref:Transient receptor potential cation channel subfamily M member 6 n=1 Tax=Paramuricea clavata TaxID=317549 RepID=A0A6S7HCZ8_PARCT|nr:Transient receptor potential cation channel subfamily M member 6 [Paramuricea clavata]
MSGKRIRNDVSRKNKNGSTPHEIIVQRLVSEADNKQTYRPIQPRESVGFEFEDLSLVNIKKACAVHFNLPASTCDVLVSNKGPSCTHISQIPHRKDKVYLVRFVVLQEDQVEEEYEINTSKVNNLSTSTPGSLCQKKPEGTKICPSSISIASLLKAGKLVKPREKNKQWVEVAAEEFAIDTQKFSSGAFRDAFRASTIKPTKCEDCVVKTYNDDAVKTIQETANSSIEDHCRKQVQMHSVARHITQRFKAKTPPGFGECFDYNRCYYTMYNGKPVTVEDCVSTKEKLMILDIQGSDYALYDPEISTAELFDGDTAELYFCCGNYSSIGIQAFLKSHKCNKYCKLIGVCDK